MSENCVVCGRTSKHFNDIYDIGCCGYHKNYLVRFNNLQITLPRCCGVTRSGVQCKRNGNIIDGSNVYCYQHKITIPTVEESTAIPGYVRDDCPICYNDLMNGTTLAKTHCGHFFHKECILRWKNTSEQGNTCPICRRDTHLSRNANKVTRIYTTIEEY